MRMRRGVYVYVSVSLCVRECAQMLVRACMSVSVSSAGGIHEYICMCVHACMWMREHAQMCACARMNVHGCVSVSQRACACAGTHRYVCPYVYVHMHACMDVCARVRACDLWLSACTCACMHGCNCACTYVYVCAIVHWGGVPSCPGPPLTSRSAFPWPPLSHPKVRMPWSEGSHQPPCSDAAGGAKRLRHGCTGWISQHLIHPELM